MRVRLRAGAQMAGPQGCAGPGDVVELPSEVARAMAARGIVEIIGEVAVAPAKEAAVAPAKEAAVAPAKEAAVAPAPEMAIAPPVEAAAAGEFDVLINTRDGICENEASQAAQVLTQRKAETATRRRKRAAAG